MSAKSVMKDLIETLEDGRKGFTDAAEKLTDDGHSAAAERFRAFAQQRQTFSTELRQAASDAGIEVDEDGSMAGALHRGWISMKDALTGDDAGSVLKAAASGEEFAVNEYEKALKDDDLPSGAEPTVRRQADEIRAAHSEVERLANEA